MRQGYFRIREQDIQKLKTMEWWQYLLANAGVTGAIGFLFKVWIEHGRDRKLEEFKAVLERDTSAWTKLQEQRANAIRAVYHDMTEYMMHFPEMAAQLRSMKMDGERERHIAQLKSLMTKLHCTVLFNTLYFTDKEASTVNGLLTSTKEFEARCFALPEAGDPAMEQKLTEDMVEFIRTKWVVAMNAMAEEFQAILGVTALNTTGGFADRKNGVPR